MELNDYLGKKIEVTICHHGIYNIHRGVLISVNSREICLRRDNGRSLWVRRPRYFKDSIKELVEK
ncbi:MAG: hypothetical protein ACFFDT_28990 [Candidatus Hodarchaeota archaeon]